jgi:hypothetical protein
MAIATSPVWAVISDSHCEAGKGQLDLVLGVNYLIAMYLDTSQIYIIGDRAPVFQGHIMVLAMRICLAK